jgi:hypothetical protein
MLIKKFVLALFFFLGITEKNFAQDVCLHPLLQDSSDLVSLCSLGLLQSADLNQDGKDDLIGSGSWVDFVTFQTFYYSGIMNSNGNGSFSQNFGSAFSPATGSATGDFNEDGAPDYVIAFISGHLDFNISNGSGGFNSASVAVTSYTGGVVSGDFDNDNHQDIMMGSMTANLYFFHGNGNGTFAAAQIITTPGYSYNLHAADVNNDGITDVIWPGTVLLSNGAGNFTLTTPSMPNSFLNVADVNTDGIVDALGTDSVFLGSGFGNFPTRVPLNLGAGFNITGAPVDLNNDHDPDLIVSKGDGQGMDTLYVFLGSVNATFIPSQFFMPVVAQNQYNICSGDFDGNGLQDFVLSRDSNAFEQCIAILQPVMNYSTQISSASASVCQGDSLQLSVNTTGQTLWNTGDTTSSIYVSAAGTYSVTTTNTYGCLSSDTIRVNQISATTFSAINSTNLFCLYSSSFPLTSGAPAGGIYSGPGVSNGIFNPQTAGIGTHTLVYAYTGTGACTGSDSIQVTVELCLNIPENNSAEMISVYPNPGDGAFTISTSEKEFSVFVYDVLGNKIYSGVNEKTIDITSQPQGIYFIRLIAGNKIYSQKIILN